MSDVDPRDRRIAELESLLTAALARISALEAEVAELKAKLRENSTNSDRPPSADPPGVARKPTEPSGRKPGGQPGHKGSKRGLVPADKVNESVIVNPDTCDHCHGPLAQREGGPDPLRHQQIEIPPVSPHVTEYCLQSGYCAACDAWTCATLPKGVPASAFGIRLSAMVSLLTGQYRLSKRLAQDLLSNLLGVELALGSISNVEQRMSDALAAPVEEARGFVREQTIVHMDETGWREALRKAWLWVAVAGVVTVFLISPRRSGVVAKEMLGADFVGFLVTDRWSAYEWADIYLRQLCWSHLARDFQGFVERGGEGAPIGRALVRQTNKMFEWWHRVRDGTLKRTTFERRMRKVETRVERLLMRAAACSSTKTAGMAKKMLAVFPAFWTFLGVEGLEPTNNNAERAIRPAVLWRKGSFGTHSPKGSRFVERVMSVVATLRQQNRNVLEYLTAAYAARLRGESAPSLLPDQDHVMLAAA